ncbi:MAG: hypothetical protein LUG99_21790 [Lachnospiraceae bacterium]|nr:hypothetical protein [Lachnospiraceae bacterium]
MKERMGKKMSKWMKKNAWFLMLMLALSFAMALPVLAEDGQETESTGAQQETTAEEQTDAAVTDGWHGKQYYQNGEAVTGFLTINGKKYYFNKNGNRVTGWKTINGKRYYFNAKGVCATGIKKIKKKYYYFKKSGALLTKTKKIDGITYYIDDNGYLEAYKKGSKYYKPNGKKMSSQETTEYETLLRAKAVVAKITTSDMSKSEKLKACFDWVVNRPYKIYRKFQKTDDWITTYANDHFLREGGECHADGAAMAYLAKAIGYTNVYVCLDCNGITAQGHCWAEINGKVYDPRFAAARGYSKYYAVSYGTYVLHPVLHVKI